MTTEAERTAPVQGDRIGRVFLPAGRIPWAVHLIAWEEYSRQFGNGQSAERMAERGGFGWGEVIKLLRGERIGEGKTFDELRAAFATYEPRAGQS